MLRSFLFCLIFCVYTGVSAQNFIQRFNSVANITVVGTNVFFTADDGVNGTELWITDGTPEGTYMVKDIYPGFNGSEPGHLTSFNGELFFTATTLQYGREVWKSDGTAAGTTLLKDIYIGETNGSDPGTLIVFSNSLYFDASPDGFNRSVYKSNGTSAGTTLLKDMGFGQVTDIEVAGSYLYYVFGIGSLWRSDGSPAGTVNVNVDAYKYIKRLTAVGNQLFFTTAFTENVNERLYMLTGAGAPALLKEFSAPVSSTNTPANFAAVGSKLFFSIQKNYDQQPKVDELWLSDGTVAGTTMVKSFPWDTQTANSAMKNFFSFSGMLYFQNGSSQNDAWWTSDGTNQGTVEVSTVRLGYPLRGDFLPAVSNGKIYLSGEGELWISDGTSVGTKQHYDINQSFSSIPSGLTDVNGVLYFIANDGYGNALWNVAPAAEVDVRDQSQSSILSGATIAFETVLTDDCSQQSVEIRNVGARELILTEITVSGKDFYISGQVPAILKPGEKFPINVYFLPFSTGERNGILVIRSNDANESRYTLQLIGIGEQGTSTTFCDAYENGSLKKSLTAGSQSPIGINKNTIVEKQPVGTIIGTLSVGASGYTYSLVNGEGGADNDKFIIEGTTLKAQLSFDYNIKNTYTIRVKAESESGDLEGQLTILVLKAITNSLPPSECIPVLQRINAALLDVEYNALGHLFVCGEGGKLLRSTDGGSTWADLNSGVTTQLTKLIFRGSVGYAAGDGVLLKSEDGGDTWSQIYVPYNIQIAAKTLFFLDANVGFAAGLGGEIVKTVDGGATWISNGQQFHSGITSMFFWNESDGIACTPFGSVHKTTNGGASWSFINTSNLGLENIFINITFIDNNIGFLLSLTNLFKTDNGGESWTEVADIGGVYFQEIRFISNDIGYVIGGYPSSELYMSLDGGTNWDIHQNVPISAGRGIAYQGGSNKVTVVGANTPDLSSTEPGSVIMNSTGGTTTWEVKHTLHSEEFYGVDFPSTNVGYVAGSEDIYKTTNGGLTWSKLSLQKPVYDVAFLTDASGYMADGYQIFSTSNGGANWTSRFQIPDTGPANLKQLVALSSSVIIVYSEGGTIYRTDNGGSTWPVVFNQPVNQLQQLHFPTSSTGFGVDLLGKVIKTVNGGATWSTVYTHAVAGESFNTIYFFDANNGLMAGANGVMYSTSNGGVNWTKAFSGIQAGIKRIIFEDTQVGYAFTDQGTVYKSSNGGQSWAYAAVMPFTGLNDVSKFQTKIYFCGQYGNLGKFDLPKPPSRPGYISGDKLVCSGDAVEYAVASSTNHNFYWSIPGTKLTPNGNQASVQFASGGQYILSVQHYSACGNSATRTLTINVENPPQPVILGPQLVNANSTVQFSIESPGANNRFNWDVTGALDFTSNGESVSVDWGSVPGDVNVMETSLSGCRAKETKAVSIDPSTIVGIPDANVIEAGVRVYPNPALSQLLIESSLSSELTVRIYNLMGQQYDVKSLQPFSSNTINMVGFPQGLYLVEISAPGEKSKAVKKIIKQ